MKYLVECRTCHKPVWVNIILYGGGYVGTCPQCKQLAYNNLLKPTGMKLTKKEEK